MTNENQKQPLPGDASMPGKPVTPSGKEDLARALPAEGGDSLLDEDPLWRTLDDWDVSTPTAAFDAQVMARVRQEADAEPRTKAATAGSTSWTSWFTGHWWATGAALASVLLAIVLFQRPAQDISELAFPTDLTMEISAQQVDTTLEDLEILEELYGFAPVEDLQRNPL